MRTSVIYYVIEYIMNNNVMYMKVQRNQSIPSNISYEKLIPAQSQSTLNTFKIIKFVNAFIIKFVNHLHHKPKTEHRVEVYS